MRDDAKPRVIMFALPCYNQQVWVNTMVSVCGAMHRITARGWGVGLETFGGHGGIHIIRNWFCKKFLDSPCTDLFFIDADVAADPDVFIRLIEHPVDVVMGLYRARHAPEVYTFLSDGAIKRDPDTGLVAIRAGPAGFTRVRRHVIEKMAASLREDEWAKMPVGTDTVPTLFNFAQRHGHYLGEDTHFFLKWEELGGKTWVDPDVCLHHWGSTQYSSTFSEFLFSKQQEFEAMKQFKALVDG